MTHAPRDIADGTRRRPQRGRPASWLFALLVMCFAVLPHLTLAASMTRMPVTALPQQAEAMQAGVAERAEAPAPCHEAAQAKHPSAATPPCCLIGCGVIAEAPTLHVLPVLFAWSRTHLPVTTLFRGLSVEPAERPPRSLPI